MRQVILCPDETGPWVAECPSLPGCTSQGETREAALRNIRDAIEQYIPSAFATVLNAEILEIAMGVVRK